MALVPLLGCVRPPDHERLPLLLGFPGQYPKCVVNRQPSKSPEEWERQDFNRRIVGRMVVLPVNVPCLQMAFSEVELSVAAEKGDPVAALVDVMTKYSLRGDACQDIGHIRRALTKAYRSPNPNSDGPISRVPEAAFLLGTIEEYCAPGGDDYDRLNLTAYDLGYDAAAARGPLVE